MAIGAARARRRHSRAPRPSYIRKADCSVDHEPTEKMIADFRMMLLRGERGPLLAEASISPVGIRCLARLLSDEYVGVAPEAAEVLGECAGKGIDISLALPALQEALKNRYAQRNAAAALAIYRKENDREGFERMLRDGDRAIREAAMDALTQGSP